MSKATTLSQLELHALKCANYTDKKIAELGESVVDAIEAIPEGVLFGEAQSLTEEQKAQARENIGAVSKSGISLGVHSDGLVYIFVDGSPVGDGIDLATVGDLIGYVDENNNIIVQGNLADGTYSVKYEMENGSTVNIGNLVLSGSEPEPTYTNLADPTSADWVVGKRFNSSGALVDVDSGVNGATTNYIGGDLVAGDIIRVKNMDLTTYRVAVYDSAKTFKITTPLNNSALASTVENVTVNTTEASFTVKAGSHLTSGGYIRFCGPLTGTSEDVIITKNEEIV